MVHVLVGWQVTEEELSFVTLISKLSYTIYIRGQGARLVKESVLGTFFLREVS